MKMYSVDTLIRRRLYVDAKNKREATTLALAILDGRVQPERFCEQFDVPGSEILTSIYETPEEETDLEEDEPDDE